MLYCILCRWERFYIVLVCLVGINKDKCVHGTPLSPITPIVKYVFYHLSMQNMVIVCIYYFSTCIFAFQILIATSNFKIPWFSQFFFQKLFSLIFPVFFLCYTLCHRLYCTRIPIIIHVLEHLFSLHPF